MKKTMPVILLLLLAAVVGFMLSRSGAPDAAPEASAPEAPAGEAPETSVIKWNVGASGNVLLTIAEAKGYFKEVGLTVEQVLSSSNADAMALVSTGQVDIASNAGTSNPLQQIASGVDFTIWGGHMVTGCMPVIARKGTVWNGPQDLIGKKFACNPAYFAFTGAVMDLGYDNPLEAVEWVTYTNYNDAIAAVVRGEVDYALLGTSNNYAIQNMDDIEVMCYQSDIMPNYSCCRMESRTEFLEKNPIAAKLLMKALIRAQQYYEANKEEALELHARAIGAEKDFVAAYMLNEHYVVSLDPLKASVVRAWGILDKTGFLSEEAKNINILDHINTTLYEEALNEVIAEHGSEDQAFYDKMRAFFEENNA